MEDDFFDDDEVLDYILYEEMRKEEKNCNERAGCFSVFIIFLIPAGLVSLAITTYNYLIS